MSETNGRFYFFKGFFTLGADSDGGTIFCQKVGGLPIEQVKLNIFPFW
jgi:hypothetical protein